MTRTPPNVLVTGFGPFPGAAFNPSGELVHRLLRSRIPGLGDARVGGHIFQTRYAAIDRELPALIARHAADVVVMFGLASRAKVLRVETSARNLMSFFPDAGAYSPARRTIARNQPARTLNGPLAVRLLHAARASGLPASLSRDAGRYVCNYALWKALEAAGTSNTRPVVAFIHIPKLRGNRPRCAIRRPRPTLDDLLKAAQLIVAAACSEWRRRRVAARLSG